LFIEELAKSVVESGLQVDAGDRFTARGPAALLAIPTSARRGSKQTRAERGDSIWRVGATEIISVAVQNKFCLFCCKRSTPGCKRSTPGRL
jgi:hypothetical protein